MTNSLLKLFVIMSFFSSITFADHWKDREEFIKREESQMIGSEIILDEKENIANAILMRYKLKEYDAGFMYPGIFAPARHYFLSREDVEHSKVFKFIQKMPKGAALHGHDTALVSEEYLYNMTFQDHLYACTIDGRLKLQFLSRADQNTMCNWTIISDLRKENSSYNKWVRSQLTLNVKNPRKSYTDINSVWNSFINIFKTVVPLITYRPVFQAYFYQALKELYEDNVMYLEFRGTLPAVYELNGTTYSEMDQAKFYEEVILQFKHDYPNFIGARFIYGPSRKVDNTTAADYVRIVKELKQNFPNFLAGFDLVGQEDLGLPLVAFIKQLEEIASNGIDFFFHAGETNWYGTSTDFNLVDAILLGTKRIGHGYSLVKHPLVLKIVKERKIAIEVCPISNQVLMLVDDMRNHPAASLIAEGYPVVISYDDPGFWSTKGLSYDFYMAFMGMASRNADLRLLKQLARNSLVYSSMPEAEKQYAIRQWEKQWNIFIVNVITAYYDVN